MGENSAQRVGKGKFMFRMTRILFGILFCTILSVAPATADKFQIEGASLGNSVGKLGVPQLDLTLKGSFQLSEPSELVAYFFDGDSGQPLTASSSSSNPYATKSGYLGCSSGSFPSSEFSILFEKKMSIPHWAIDTKQKGNRIRVELFLHPGDAEHVKYVDSLNFKFKLPKTSKFREDQIRQRISFRDRLPELPIIRMDGLGRWDAITLSDPTLTFDRNLMTTLFIEKGRNIVLGGQGVRWRHEGSSIDWRELYDRLDVRKGVVLPVFRPMLIREDDVTPRQVLIEARVLQVGDQIILPRQIPTLIEMPDPRRPQVLIESRILEVGNRNVAFDFTANRATGVPLLGKIPVLSRLFRNTGIGREGAELIIQVTPRVLIQEE